MSFDYTPQVNTNVVSGMCSFRVLQKHYSDIKKMYVGGARIFYITTTNKGVRTLIYSGMFIPEDMVVISKTNNIDLIPVIKPDIENPNLNNVAVVTRRVVTLNNSLSKPSVASIKSVNKFAPVKFQLDPRIKLI